jgi:N-acetylated-alpha-linked acidic dipeptidase
MSLRALVPLILFGCSLVASATQAPGTAPTGQMAGYTRDHAAAERAIEQRFASLPSPDRAREFHRYFTAEPHPASSERNNALARYIADTWKQQGLEDVTLHEYDVLNSFPRSVLLEMTAPVHYVAGLREAAYDVDPDTRNPNVHGGYLSMSRSGDITVPIVYAHSGNPEDYAVLRAHGIDVHGKAVLVRYSNPYSYRGFKALTAEREGAAAILIYSDPAEDGYRHGAVFPDGPWGPETHIQRGAITYDFMVPGDPLTPGWASVPGAKRITMDEARSMPKIMGVAMSWHDAKPLLEHMGGPAAPKDWQGGLPIRYRLGGDATIHLKVDMDNSVKPNFVVEGRIRGSDFPNDLIVLGNHRDAWEFGGVDPSSGTASMMEMTRVLGQLATDGVRPRRTLVFCSWDGEEIGLTGSTEWGEQFADTLKRDMVAYLNVDSSTSGPNLTVTAVASLAPMIVDVTRGLKDPSGASLHDAWTASATRTRREAGTKDPVTDDNLVDTQIGSGSDHTVFLNLLGRPTVGLQFDGPYGVYHSMYDDFYWVNHFGDPGYRYHVLMSELWGTVALRLANADVLPYDFATYARNIRRFVGAVEKTKGAAGRLDLAPLRARIDALEQAGTAMNDAVARALGGETRDGAALERASRALMDVEGNWLDPDGIPGRPWFKHLLYAARYTYAHLELPGLTEAAEGGRWDVAADQARRLEAAVAKNTDLLRRAAEALRP